MARYNDLSCSTILVVPFSSVSFFIFSNTSLMSSKMALVPSSYHSETSLRSRAALKIVAS